MARIQQINPGNYASSVRINEEFESIIRYLVASERGNKTLKELMALIFNESGEVSGILELRNDASAGIQYRVGTYTNDSDGWQTLVSLDALRGEPGVSSGTVILPVITSRTDYTGDNSEDTFDYTFTSEDEVLVFLNGVLQREGGAFDYTLGTNQVIFSVPPALNDSVTFFKVRAESTILTTRVDTTPASSQSVFAFVFPSNAYELYVYKNGVLQREGGAYDYTTQPGTNTITFTSPVLNTDTVTTLLIEATGETAITGLMTEENYVNSATGKIDYLKIGIDDDEIPQSKIANLVTDLGGKAVLAVNGTEPLDPSTGDLWLDTSVTPNVLRFYDGIQYIATSPESSIPPFNATNALQYLRVNGTGTNLELSNVDLSGLIPVTQKGAANGVPSLDSSGLIPEGQMPEVRGTMNYFLQQSGAVTNGTYTVTNTYKTRIRLTGISAQLASGSCQIQVKVAGTLVGAVYAVSSTVLDQPLSTLIEIDSTMASKILAVEVSSASSANTLSVSFSVEILE